jgi:hypothetical protein
VRQKGTPPRGFGVGDAAADHLGGQPAHRATAQVQQTGLAGQRLPVIGHPQHIPGLLTNTAGGQHVYNGVVAVEVEDVLAQPTSDTAEVQLGLDDHTPRHDLQAPGEAQQGGHLGTPRADRSHHQATQLIFDLGCHRHASSPLGPP